MALFAVGCGEDPQSAANTGGVPGGGVGGSASGVGGSPPGAGNGSGGSTAGSGNTAGTAPVGGASGSGSGGALSGAGGAGGVGSSGAGGTASGAAGLAGTSGASGAGGAGGTGATGGAGAGGTGGTGGSVSCTITVNHTRSTAIPTVEIVTFTTDLTGMTSARIDFGLAGQTPMSAPVNLAEPSYRTLLLGMKASREYVFRVVATGPTGTCTSADQTIMTGALASGLPRITRTAMNAAMQDRGFIITSPGVQGGGGGGAFSYIIDADGDIVWWAPAPGSTSRARMSFDGKDMYMLALNVQNTGGEMRKVSMDGMTTMMNIQGLATGHHDFTVLPDNGIAVIIWRNSCTAIVERSASGTLTDVVANVNTIYQATADCHTNAINYYASDQTYTLSDRNVNLFVKIRRNGQLIWQFGGQNPRGQTFTGMMSWQVNHGHQLLPDGKFIFFNNGPMQNGMSAALEFQLNETAWTSSKTSWEYRVSGVNSAVLSDVQRLPNGNTLVTYSTSGQIHEVSPTGTLVQRLQGTSFGYSEFRKSMYGPPLR